MRNRDDFPAAVKTRLAQRVRYLCSKPDCGAPTARPKDNPYGAVNIGVAGHISSAAPGGPRYNPNLTRDQRRDIDNGIWLCQNCGKPIDSDEPRFTKVLLPRLENAGRGSCQTIYWGKQRLLMSPRSPLLELYLELDGEGINPDYYTHDPVRRFVIGLHNAGKAIAKFPSIRFSFAAGLALDPFGIDGNIGYGLSPSPSEQGWAGFHGGSDRIIHAGQLKITKLFQRGENKRDFGISATEYPHLYRYGSGRLTHHRWVFNPVHFACEISAEGIPTFTAEKDFPAAEVVWPHRN